MNTKAGATSRQVANVNVRPEYTQNPNNPIDIVNAFRYAMYKAGINYHGEIISDGRLHRFHIEGHKRATKNGAYVLYTNKHPAGWFMDYKSGISQTWRSSSGTSLSCILTKQINEAKRQRDAEMRQRHDIAAGKAIRVWKKSKLIASRSAHAYLVKKDIQPHGARLHGQSLVIPIHNESDALINLQFISPDGEKRFLSGGRKRGCFHIIGDCSNKVLICEGFATGASLYEDSGQRVVVAFDAGNLLPVAQNIRDLSADSEIIICGDNDLSGIGQAKAKEAALAIGGKVLISPISDTDWNDCIAGGIQ